MSEHDNKRRFANSPIDGEKVGKSLASFFLWGLLVVLLVYVGSCVRSCKDEGQGPPSIGSEQNPLLFPPGSGHFYPDSSDSPLGGHRAYDFWVEVPPTGQGWTKALARPEHANHYSVCPKAPIVELVTAADGRGSSWQVGPRSDGPDVLRYEPPDEYGRFLNRRWRNNSPRPVLIHVVFTSRGC